MKSSDFTGRGLCGRRLAPTRPLLGHQSDVIAKPRLQTLDVGGAGAGGEGQLLFTTPSVAGFDGEPVAVDVGQ